jgi:prolyl 4-hydroxylase
MSQPYKRDFDEVIALFNGRRLADAEAAARALVGAHPDAAPAYNILGVIQASHGNVANSLDNFGKASSLKPDWDEPHYNLGLAQCKLGEFGAAVESFRAALRLKPANAAAEINLGNALRELGALEDAVGAYTRALKTGGPARADIQINLGVVSCDLGRFDDAILYFRRAVEIQPNHSEGHLNLGRALQRLGRLDDALASLRRAFECAPTSADAMMSIANVLRDLGRPEEAIAAYRRVLELKPDESSAHYHLGLALLDLGRHAEGLGAIAKGPGIVHFRLENENEAGAAPKSARRVALGHDVAPNFIGCWFLEDANVCEGIVEFFENHRKLHGAGRIGRGIDPSAKHSTDITVLPKDLDSPGYEPIAKYLRQLESCYRDYTRQWPFLGQIFRTADVVPFTIQRYQPGGHFSRMHSERTSFGVMHRVLAWMTYLNDVDNGGETRFHHYDLDIRPERGKTLIWPAEWTHAHSGGVVTAGSKYIITGWMHFPYTPGAS